MRIRWLAVGVVLWTTTAIAQGRPPQTDTHAVPHDIPVRYVEGMVVDAEGLPIPAAMIQEFSWNWEYLLAETRTDREGRFVLVPGAPVRIHYLRVSALGFDILQVRVDEAQKAGTLRLRLRAAS